MATETTYQDRANDVLNEYNELKRQYEEKISTDRYQYISSFMPFELLSVKQTLETLDLFSKFEKKPKIVFKTVEEAEVLYDNLKNVTTNADALLDSAAFIENVDNLANKINALVDSSVYLSDSLKVSNTPLLTIARECLVNLPKRQDLLTFDFRYNFVESCLYCLNKDDIQRLVSKKMITGKDIDHISLSENKQYEENLQYLCMLTDHKDIIKKTYETRLKGVMFQNPDGTQRQDILKELQMAVNNKEPINLTVRRYTYTPPQGQPEPAIGIDWKGKCIGNLPLVTTQEIVEKYDNCRFRAEFEQVIGGGDKNFGCVIKFHALASKVNRPNLIKQLNDLEAKLPEIEKGSFTEAEKQHYKNKISELRKELDEEIGE